ncbi:MAG: hypothetical protein WD739_11620 [Actinomycetota bacterium]
MPPAATGDGRALGVEPWAAPLNLAATSSWLTWQEPIDSLLDDDPDAKRIRSFDRLLADFGRVAEDEDGQEILAFATRWGPLDLCHHGLPRNHPGVPSENLALVVLQTSGNPSTSQGKSRCQGTSQGEWRAEPCSAWRRMASVFTLMQRAVIAVVKDEAPNPEVWGGLHPNLARISDLSSFRGVPPTKHSLAQGTSDPMPPEALPLSTDQQADEARRYVEFLLDDLLLLTDFRLTFQWPERGPRLALRSVGGLFDALVMQLHLSATNGVGFAICSACVRPYAPSRRPAASKRNYCYDCRDRKRDKRDAKRDDRARRRSV